MSATHQNFASGGRPARRAFRPRRAGGHTLIYAMFALTAMLAVGSLAVDVARVHLTRTELQIAADAAARAAAGVLVDQPTDSVGATAAAVAAAAMNRAGGTSVDLLPSDVVLGNWSEERSPQFVANLTPLNAAKVIARRDGGRGNAVPLAFAVAVGKSTWDVSAAAVAKADPASSPQGIVGIDRVTFASIGVLAQVSGDLASNGDVDVGMPLGLLVSVDGEARSYSGTVRKGFLAGISGTTASLPEKLWFPVPKAPSQNDNSKLSSLLSSGNDFTTILGATIPAGTYVVRNLNMLAGIAVNVEGPVTFYVTGNVNIAAGVNLLGSANPEAKNFRVRVVAGGQVNFLANLLTPVYMDLYAPDSDIVIAVGVNHFKGRLVGKSLNVCLPVLGKITQDTTLDPAVPGGVSLVK